MDTAQYYDDHWHKRAGRLSQDPEFQRKVQLILEMIPQGVDSILDVGCGDGSITNVLANNHSVTGVDLSPVGLKQIDMRVRTVLASADALPFPDRGFDLVFSSELLEHLDSASLYRAIREFGRLARRYILISVPNKEKLQKRFARCGNCRQEFHIYGHAHSFSLSKLRQLLPGWKLIDSQVCGYPDAPSLNAVGWLRNRIAGSYFYVEAAICPYCGAELVRRQPARIKAVADFLLRGVQKVILVVTLARAKPDWLLALFSRS